MADQASILFTQLIRTICPNDIVHLYLEDGGIAIERSEVRVKSPMPDFGGAYLGRAHHWVYTTFNTIFQAHAKMRLVLIGLRNNKNQILPFTQIDPRTLSIFGIDQDREEMRILIYRVEEE